MNFKNAISAFTRTAGRQTLVMKKHSPTMLLGVGVVGVVATAVLASRATLKLAEITDEAHEKLDKIDATVSSDTNAYTDEDAEHDKLVVIAQTWLQIAQAYAPAIGVGVASIAALTGSHVILQRRNVALTAAYATVHTAFEKYRGRVVDALGRQSDAEFMYGATEHEIVEETPSGPVVKTIKRPSGASMYARFFDEGSLKWQRQNDYNALFVRCQQNYANDLLRSRGHVFLNEVYEMLGLPHTKEGAVVGWVNNSVDGDGFIDFGVFEGDTFSALRFVNGDERSILLDFNVDGVIYDKI